MTPLDIDELTWLLSLTTRQRRKKESDLAKTRPKPGQPKDEFFKFRQSQVNAVAWTRSIEDHLIQLVAAIDPDAFRMSEHRQRLYELRKTAA